MSYNGTGTFNLISGNPVVTGTTISSTWANNTLTDIATGLTTAICKDGQTTITGNIPMSNFKFTGLAAGSTAGNSIRYEQIFGNEAAIGASLVLISSAAASSSATIDFTTGLDNTYDCYMIQFDAVVPATDDVYLSLRIGTGAGPTWQSSGGSYSYSCVMSGPGGLTSMGSVTDAISDLIAISRPGAGQGIGNSTGEHAQGFVFFENPDSSNYPLFGYQVSYMRSDAVGCDVRGTGNYGATTAITGVRFLLSSGNIASGNFRLYGLRK